MIGINVGLNLGSRFGGLVQAVVETFTYFGGEISYTVDGVNGQYADGSYWTTGSVTDMAPAFATGVTRTLEDTSTVAGTEVNGWMVNPGNAALYKGGDVLTLALRQAANYGTGSNMEPQAYDSFVATNNLAYDAATRVALPLTSGTVIKAKSQIAGVDNNARPALEYNAALTIVSSAPAAGSIRPPIAAASKTSILNTSTLNLALLRNLDVSGFVNSLPSYSEALEWLAQLTTFESCYNVLSRNIIADNGTTLSPYHGDISLQWSQIMLAMHTNAYTVAQKETLAIQFGMIAGDIAARVNEGGVFQANGGHSAGRLPIVAFAAELFNSTYLRDACSVLAQVTISSVVTSGQSVYGDLGQLHYVTQPMIDASVGQIHPFPQAMLGYPSWSSQYAVDPATRVAGNIMGNSLVNDNTGVTNSASYQPIVGKALAGHSLSLRLLQGVTANVPALYHDYTDRWVGFEANDDYVFLEGALVKSGANPTPAWVLEAYTAFSPLVSVWTPETTYTAILDGQSQEAYWWIPTDTYNGITRPTITGGNMTTYRITSNGAAPAVVPVTDAALQAKEISIPIAALSEALNFIAPGKYFHLGGHVVPGTGRYEEADNANAGRLASDKTALVSSVRTTSGKDIDAYIECWMGNDSSSAKTMHESFAPLMYKQTSAGSAFVLGNTNPDAVNSTAIFDNARWDAAAAAGDLGEGIFRKNVTSLNFLGWPKHSASPSNGLEGLNFTTDSTGSTSTLSVGRANQHNRPSRANYKALLDQGAGLGIDTYFGPGAHSAYMFDGGVPSTHPVTNDSEGVVDIMWARIAPLLRMVGRDVTLPTFGSPSISEDRLTITIPVTMPTGATLTTKALLRGQAFPATPSPHQQEVTGFELRLPADTYEQRRPIFRTDSGVSYPDAYKGTVSIVGGAIQIVMQQAIPAGDAYLYFLDGDASAVLLDPRDTTNRLYRNFPLAHIPDWYDNTFIYPMPGFDFDTQVELLVSSASAPMTNTVTANQATWDGDPVLTNVVADDLAEYN